MNENTVCLRENVFAAISAERNNQDKYQQAGRFKFTCAQDGLSDSEKMTVLTEEHGEVATEVCELFDKGECPERRARLKKELIQTAAVAVAWLEAIERQEAVARNLGYCGDLDDGCEGDIGNGCCGGIVP